MSAATCLLKFDTMTYQMDPYQIPNQLFPSQLLLVVVMACMGSQHQVQLKTLKALEVEYFN